MHNDARRTFGTLVGHSDIGYQRQAGEVNHIVMALNLVAEEVEEEQDAERQQKADSGSRGEDGVGTRTHLPLEKRLVNKFSLVGCGSQRNAVLLTFLQKQQVEAGVDILLTAYLVEHTLLDRGHRHTPQMLGIECLQALTVDVGIAAGLQQSRLDVVLQLVDSRRHGLNLWSFLTGGLQQTVTVLHSLVVVSNEFGSDPV